MGIKSIVTIGLSGLLIMTGLKAIGNEELVRENGKVSALKLPLDKTNSTKSFETATFGIG